MTHICKGRAPNIFINKINFWADEQGYKCCNVSRSYSSVKRINHKSKQLSTHLIRNIIQCFVAVMRWTHLLLQTALFRLRIRKKNTFSIHQLMWLKGWHANAICGMDVGRVERIMRFSTSRGVFHYFISKKLTNCDITHEIVYIKRIKGNRCAMFLIKMK